ncbi:MAG: NADH-quinone oxidoreductase subunit L [Verrucomicrobiales bacterium]
MTADLVLQPIFSHARSVSPLLPALILLLPLAAAVKILLLPRRLQGFAPVVSVGSVIATLVLSVILWVRAGKSDTVAKLTSWIDLGPSLQLDIGFNINPLATGMMLVVTFVGALVHVFSLAYMKDDAGKARYFAGLSLFMFSMTGIVLADNLPMMFIFWELVGVSSYILIGHWYEKNTAADAAKKAFLTNRIGDFGFMIGILMLWKATGSVTFDGIEAAAQTGLNVDPGWLTAAVLAIFCGAVGKSAQLPLHVWLPDAMEGPTPVSALIHAATMVAAGVYMMIRVSFLLVLPDAATAATVIAWTGGLTALFAALCATQQNDIKKILAYSTLSQLGYMIMAVGLLAKEAAFFHLFTHAFFKALLFLGSGAVIYACHHEQDIWKMGGLAKKMPKTALTFFIGTAALIALPFVTSGWYSKEAILHAAHEHGGALFFIGAATAFLTAFYMSRLCLVAFLGQPRDHGAEHAHDVPMIMLAPLVALAVPSVIGGFEFFAGRFLALPPAGHTSPLPMIASLIALAAGVGLGWLLYHGRTTDPLRIGLFARKFFFDELYAKLVAWGQDAVAKIAHYLDILLIDGLGVRGLSGLAAVMGSGLRRLQSGNLQAYGFLFGFGVIVLLFIALSLH